MNRAYTGIVMILGLMASSAASASGAFTGRVGVLVGPYSYSEKFESPPGTVVDEYDETDFTAGLLGGVGLTLGRFYLDGGVEVSRFVEGDDFDGDGTEDDTYRSDGLLNAGVFLGDRWVIFAGYRSSTFGDGAFSDQGGANISGNTQKGPFLGGGVSFRPGKRISLGASAAYNTLTYEQEGTPIKDVDLDGISVKLQLAVVGTPHAVFLRFQRFNAEYEPSGAGFKFEYDENFLNVGYQATFDFASW